MADEPKTDTTDVTDPSVGKVEPELTKTFTQDDLDRIVSERVARERQKYSDHDDLKAKAARLDEIEEANKTENEKLAGKVGSLTDDNTTLKSENARLRVGLEKGLPADLIDRLRGKTQEELAEDADKLLELVKAREETPIDFDGGAREPAPEPKTPEQAHDELLMKLFQGARTGQ